MGDAFNLFLHQVNLNHGLPFEVKIPNAETKQAISDARQGKNLEEISLNDLKWKSKDTSLLLKILEKQTNWRTIW